MTITAIEHGGAFSEEISSVPARAGRQHSSIRDAGTWRHLSAVIRYGETPWIGFQLFLGIEANPNADR
jgi:hypothetical protein